LNIVVQKVVEGIFFQSGTRYLDGACNWTYCTWNTNIGGYGHRIWENSWDKTLGTYNVVFSYTEENVGLSPQNQPLRSPNPIAGTEYDLESDLQKMREIRERVRLGPSTGSIVEEAVSRNILDPIRN
jgi:hypothetical protein